MATRTVTHLYDSYDEAASVVGQLKGRACRMAISAWWEATMTIELRDRSRGAEGIRAGSGASVGTLLGEGAGLLAGSGRSQPWRRPDCRGWLACCDPDRCWR